MPKIINPEYCKSERKCLHNERICRTCILNKNLMIKHLNEDIKEYEQMSKDDKKILGKLRRK